MFSLQPIKIVTVEYEAPTPGTCYELKLDKNGKNHIWNFTFLCKFPAQFQAT